MRTRILGALLAAVAFLPAAAPAQSEDMPEEEYAPEGGGETEGAEVIDTGDHVRMNGSGRTAAPGEVHTVSTGDTLWDLSQRYLGSPWYWPKVWSYNPEIANPHWIYPGNRVRFFPSGEEVPTQVEVGTGPVDRGPAPTPSSGVTVVGKIGYIPKNSVRISGVSFVTPKELAEAGVIESSFSEHTLLSFPDTVYIYFDKKGEVRLGDRYLIYKTRSKVTHPVTGEPYGHLTQVLGTVKIISTSDRLVTGLIEKTFDEVTRGDLIGPVGEDLVKNVAPRPNDRELKGHIIAAMDPEVTTLGEHQMIVIDKGGSDGVQAGNTFTVIRSSDGARLDLRNPAEVHPGLPTEDVGTCMAIDVKDRATTCMVVRSLRELVVGDRVVMRPAGAAGSPRASLR